MRDTDVTGVFCVVELDIKLFVSVLGVLGSVFDVLHSIFPTIGNNTIIIFLSITTYQSFVPLV